MSGVSGADALKSLAKSVDGIPWGAFVPSLSEEEARACQEGGADLLAFGLESTAGAISGEDEMARLVTVAPGLSDRELRAIAALPVDCFIVDMTAVSGSWTLQDLVTLGAITRRSDKQVLVQVSGVPEKNDLRALRDMGASALIVDLAAVSPEDLGRPEGDIVGHASSPPPPPGPDAAHRSQLRLYRTPDSFPRGRSGRRRLRRRIRSYLKSPFPLDGGRLGWG